MNVAVLGASPNPSRYANKAIKALLKYGHTVFPVNPAYTVIEGLKAYPSLKDLKDKIHTVTVYLGPELIKPIVSTILAANPTRIIANPGAESEDLKAAANAAGIDYLEACTLVLLSISKF